MPAPLRTILAALWVPCIAGATVILLLSLGWTGWATFVVAAVIGVVLGIPAGIWTARKIKRQDPGWPDEDRKTKSDAQRS